MIIGPGFTKSLGRACAYIGAVLLGITLAVCEAAPIGDPQQAKPTYQVGVSAGMARSDVDDPSGNANSENYPSLSLVGIARFGQDQRVLGQLFFNSFTLEPGVQTVGQDVKQTGASAIYQRRIDWQTWKPWFGAGIGYSRDRFENRLTVAPDGFVAQRFPNREENAFLLLLGATTQWRVTDRLDLALHLQYDLPLQGDVKTLLLSLLLLY